MKTETNGGHGLSVMIDVGHGLPQSGDIRKDLEMSGGDGIKTVVRAAASLVSGLSQTAELMDILGILGPPLIKRTNTWLIDVYDGLKRMEERVEGLTPEALAANDKFITTLAVATRMAASTHQPEKLDALRAAALNSALMPDLDAELQAFFLQLVDQMTVSHIRLLAYYHDPVAFSRGLSVTVPGQWTLRWRNYVMPEYDQRPGFYAKVIQDIRGYGLVVIDDLAPIMVQDGKMVPNKADKSYSNELGKQFMAYITLPEEAAAP